MRPFWMYYGAKWRLAPRYPAPRHDHIIEPFAGAAGYSVRHNAPKVTLFDIDPVIVGVWRYLLRVTDLEVLALPDITEGTTTEDYGLCQEARWFVGFWMNAGVPRPRCSPSAWLRGGLRPRSKWGPEVRHRIAAQLQHIRHWTIHLGSYHEAPDLEGTWFVDPPYQGKQGSHYTHSTVDYEHLAQWCRARRGQVVVCEGGEAGWLPFRPLVKAKTARAQHAQEQVWP